jgi:protein SCO1
MMRYSASRLFLQSGLVLLLLANWPGAAPGLLRADPALEPAPLPSLAATPGRQLTIPTVELINQDGKKVPFGSESLRGKVAVISFIFTSCATVCPLIGANLAQLEEGLMKTNSDLVELISITVDPSVDTPARLRQWGERFGRKGKWQLLTGSPRTLDKVLRVFGESVAGRTSHSPLVWIGGEAAGGWRRVDGVASRASLALGIEQAVALTRGQPAQAAAPAQNDTARLIEGHKQSPPPAAPAQAHPYFPDVELIDQDGQAYRFYSDILQDHTVLINSFFTECQSVCPVMMNRLADLQARYSDQLGQQLRFVSISVDPLRDTPARLRVYADRLKVKPGWLLLTGTKPNVELVLSKLGQFAATREAHSNLLILGNEPTGLWKKGFGLASSKELEMLLGSVLDDDAPAAPSNLSPGRPGSQP